MATSSIYGLNQHARCIVAQLGEPNRHRFMVGSQSLRQENEIHLIEYLEEASDIVLRKVFQHPDEVSFLAPSPRDPGLLFSCHSDGATSGATLWRLVGEERMPSDIEEDLDEYGMPRSSAPEPAEESTDGVLTPVCALGEASAGMRSIVYSQGEGSTDATVVGLQAHTITVFDMANAGGGQVAAQSQASLPPTQLLQAGAWNPHHLHEFSVAHETTVSTFDLRSMEVAYTIENAHDLTVRDVDYNPNKPWCVLTGGDDCKAKFWDLRNASKPLKVLTGHSHWVWQAKYNRHFDQLVLTAGSDALVQLWRVSSVSSAPLLELDDDAQDDGPPDALVRAYDEAEESVYSCAWSACDAWVFASLSYDGRVVVNTTPSTTKYALLL